MNKKYTRRYFVFPIYGSSELHGWLDEFSSILDSEVSETLKELHNTSWSDQEHILVYLHYMYMYRFSLPVLEAVYGRENLLEKPQIAQYLLLSCLLGRFIDDIVDCDSGFWNIEQAHFWYSHFLSRCENLKKTLSLKPDFDDAWLKSVNISMAMNRPLYEVDGKTNKIKKPDSNPMPLIKYPERIPYCFCLLDRIGEDSKTLGWARSYVSALFFLYDIDDSINDILRNVPTGPSYEILIQSLDSEGRIKVRQLEKNKIFPKLWTQSKELLTICRDNGRSLGLELGPAIIDDALYEFGLEG
jgi:hypothetical protein